MLPFWPHCSPAGRCTWTRLQTTKAKPEVVVARGSAAGPVTVSIRANDNFFETQGCANWHRTGR